MLEPQRQEGQDAQNPALTKQPNSASPEDQHALNPGGLEAQETGTHDGLEPQAIQSPE